jgi:hypothetical protein
MGGGSFKLWQNSLNTTTLSGAVSALSIYGVLGIENAPSGGLEDEVEVKKRGGSPSCGGVGGGRRRRLVFQERQALVEATRGLVCNDNTSISVMSMEQMTVKTKRSAMVPTFLRLKTLN